MPLRLPEIVAQERIPSGFPAPKVGLDAAGAPELALAHGSERLAGAFSQIADQQQALVLEKRRQQDANQALGALLDATKSLDTIESELKLGKKDALGQTIDPPAGPNDYLPRWQKSWAAIREQTLGGIQQPEVRRAAEHLLLRTEIERGHLAGREANRLFLDTELATINAHTRDLVQQAAMDPNPDARDFYRSVYAGYLAGKASLSQVEREHRSASFDEEVGIFRARAAMRAGTFDPIEVAKDVKDPVKLGALMHENLTISRQVQLDAEKALTEQKHATMGQLVLAARAGRFTLSDLPAYQAAWRFDGHETEFLRREILGSQEGDSNPATLREARIRSRSATVDEGTRTWLVQQYEGRRLSGPDFEHFDNAAHAGIQSRKADQREGQAERRFQYGEAERKIHGALAIRSIFPDIEAAGQNSVGLALDELWTRYNAGEDPAAIYSEVIAKHVALNAPIAQGRIRAIEDMLPDGAKTLQALGPREQARAKFGYTDDQYDQIAQKLVEVRRIREELARRATAAGIKAAETKAAETKAAAAVAATRTRPSFESVTP